MNTPSYRLERTQNKNSRASFSDGSIVIRLARGLPRTEEERHIEVLLKKMATASAREALRSTIDPFRTLLHGEMSASIHPVIGTPFHVKTREGGRMRIHESGDHWILERTGEEPKKHVHRFLWKVLAFHSGRVIDTLVRSINAETFRSHITDVSLKFMRSRWGSCSSHGIIALSTPLLCTDEDILRYVIIHELAHTKHPDHSPAFWRTVENAEPEYASAYKKLKNYRLPQI